MFFHLFVLAVAAIVPEKAVAFLTLARAALGIAGGGLAGRLAGGLTDAVSKTVSNIFYGNKIMSQKKIICWKENFSGKLRNLQRGNSKESQLREKTDSIFNKFSSEAKKLPMDELTKLSEEIRDLNDWSKDLEGIISHLKEIKGKFQELQST